MKVFLNKHFLRWLLLCLSALSLSVVLVLAQDAGQPDTVVVPGTIQTALGCGEWDPAGECTALTYSPDDGLWIGTFDLPAGEYEYKVAINGSWDENYGGMADAGGPNVSLVLAEDTAVTFIYDHMTHWLADSVSDVITNVPGSFQDEIGCPGEWAPDCLRSWLQDPGGDGIYTFVTTAIPAGDYEAKVAVNQTWDVNYGADGAAGGANIAFNVPVDYVQVTFSFDTADNTLDIAIDESIVGTAPQAVVSAEPVVVPAAVAQPDMVVIPGTLQPALGCAGEWDPAGACTALTFDAEDGIWTGTFDLPAGTYEYKVAINGSWGENYGGSADPGGPNISLSLEEDTTVRFYYDHATHWVADSVGDLIATAPGSYQDEIGCPGEWAPDCLRSWLQDPDGDGVFTFQTTVIPAGDYEVKVAINESWDENYGADGAPGGANIPFSVPEDGMAVNFAYVAATNMLEVGVGAAPEVTPVAINVDLSRLQAVWISEDTIAWDVSDFPDDATFRLHYSDAGNVSVSDSGTICCGSRLTLTRSDDGLTPEQLERFPHLADCATLKIDDDDLDLVPEILRAQVFVSATAADRTLIDATGLQLAGVLDELYTTDAPLGVNFDGDVPMLSVWAPTAQTVRLHLFADREIGTEAVVLDMTRHDDNGVWSITGEPDWNYRYYLYEVTVFAPAAEDIVTNLVTDPYSLSLSMNSARSQIVNLQDPELFPEGWEEAGRLEALAPEDRALYELHIRDFSANDSSVPEELRGTYMAFTVMDSAGMLHLAAAAEAGLTDIHLLPTFDIASINENAAERVEPDPEELASFPPDSDQQTALIDPIRDQDAFNWGYDPYHYNTPEGSYSTDPEGAQRIREFRAMVQALNSVGLRVVLDVVYNHTNSAGQSERSVLDRVVPGYYHRYNNDGRIATSTCCQNTATENNMMERLMVDSVLMWARDYHVDGFRFDLMGHHMLRNMVAVREALDSLTAADDGVDGESIYVYGEGWDFGEVGANGRGINATQLNIGGTGIGVFNDRVRDAARGGNPFGDYQHQGFITGLYDDPNGFTPGTPEEQLDRLLLLSDHIRLALAGNLRDYPLVNAAGETVTGAEIDYNGNPAGYTLDPQENIVYVAAHDNETLWDAIQYKAPEDADIAQRVRMNNLGLSIVALSQGVPFFHAGDDMLRSKSMDGNSYNSGDWFNRLDFTYNSNNWAVGLPPSRQDNWEMIEPLLANPDLAVGQEDILNSVMHLREMLSIRQSSPLFRLQTADDVIERLSFLNTGPDQMPGVIVLVLDDTGDVDLDPNAEQIVVIFNATTAEVAFADEIFDGAAFSLHPLQQESHDPIVQGASFSNGEFTVPARTTAVFLMGE